MMSGSVGNGAEADRWLATAEKLLATRDLQGARTFAIRARDSDVTRAELANRILAVSETLLAGDNPVSNTLFHDWYAILRIVRFTNSHDVVASQYRSLALLLNPAKNRLPFSDQAFKLISDAWYVLSNPTKKTLYDHELQLSQLGQLGQLGEIDQSLQQQQQLQEQQQQPAQQQQPEQPIRKTPQLPVRKSPRKRDGKEAVEVEHPNLKNATKVAQQDRSAEPTWKPRSTEPVQRTPVTEATWKSRSVGTPQPNQANASAESEAASFWTACPYCYMLYEYQKMYEECTLKCQNCRRAFHAVMIPSPPLTGKDTYFCCWGYFPLGFTDNDKGKGGSSSAWSPISSIFACPIQNPSQGQYKSAGKQKKSAPRVYYDDDDVYIDISDPSGEDDDAADDEWQDERPSKKGKYGKGKGSLEKKGKKPPVERIKRGSSNASGQVNLRSSAGGIAGGSGENMNEGTRVQDGMVAGTSGGGSRLVGSSGRKQMGSGAKDLGKLDLNVEFNNDGEEPAAASRVSGGSGSGNREEDNMEGTGFFEGLEEFLSSLPILSVVANDKVKAT